MKRKTMSLLMSFEPSESLSIEINPIALFHSALRANEERDKLAARAEKLAELMEKHRLALPIMLNREVFPNLLPDEILAEADELREMSALDTDHIFVAEMSYAVAQIEVLDIAE